MVGSSSSGGLVPTKVPFERGPCRSTSSDFDAVERAADLFGPLARAIVGWSSLLSCFTSSWTEDCREAKGEDAAPSPGKRTGGADDGSSSCLGDVARAADLTGEAERGCPVRPGRALPSLPGCHGLRSAATGDSAAGVGGVHRRWSEGERPSWGDAGSPPAADDAASRSFASRTRCPTRLCPRRRVSEAVGALSLDAVCTLANAGLLVAGALRLTGS